MKIEFQIIIVMLYSILLAILDSILIVVFLLTNIFQLSLLQSVFLIMILMFLGVLNAVGIQRIAKQVAK